MKVVVCFFFLSVVILFAFADDNLEIDDTLIEKQFKNEDANGDERVSLDEIKKAAEIQGGGVMPSETLELLKKNFQQTDINKDGFLSLQEVKGHVDKKYGG